MTAKSSRGNIGRARPRARQQQASPPNVWLIAGHDLRQPLQSLSLTARMLTLDCSDDDRRAAAGRLALVVSSLDQMITILHDMARLDAGSRAVLAHPVSLDAMLTSVIADCSGTTTLPIEVRVAADACDVITDRHLLAMTVKGLLLFAIKHGNGAVIAVETRRVRSSTSIEIVYAGGAPTDAMDRQAFIEIWPTTADDSGGLTGRSNASPVRLVQGVGLAVVQHLVTHLKARFDHVETPTGVHRLSLTL